MRNLITMLTGATLRIVATPLIVTGITAQATGRGIAATGNALTDLGERAELKGLKADDKGAEKIHRAHAGFAESKADRKARRDQALRERREEKSERAAFLASQIQLRATIKGMDKEEVRQGMAMAAAAMTAGPIGPLVDV